MKITSETGDMGTIIGGLLYAFPKSEWKGDNVLTIKEKGKEVGDIKLTPNTLTTTEVKLVKKVKELKSLIENREKNKIKKEDKSIFENFLQNENSFGGLTYNPILLKVIEDKFKELKISGIKIRGSLDIDKTINKDGIVISIAGSPTDDNSEDFDDGYFTRLKTHLFTEYKSEMGITDAGSISLDSVYRVALLQKEKRNPISIKGMEVGHYYPERNFLHLYYNPFKLKDAEIYEDKPNIILQDLFEAIKECKIRKVKTFDMSKRIFISAFMNKSRQKLKQISRDIKSHERDVKSYEKTIRDRIEKIHRSLTEEEYIKANLETNGKGIFDEIEKAERLPFVDKIEVGAGAIDMKFNSTFITIPNLKKSFKDFGKRHFWVGSIGFKINPSEFYVYGDSPTLNGNPHPHGSGHEDENGFSSPCFGDGDGRRQIYDLLAANRFEDLAKMLWFWIKTYKDSGAYVHSGIYYDDRLQQGYPVFDDKGKRIKINDEKRIKDKEQHKITPSDNYKENIVKFKDTKLN